MLQDGELVAAVQEERFSRKKHDARFPGQAISYCLDTAGLRLDELDRVVFYDKPLIKFERLLETYMSYAPRGFRSFVAAMPVWLKEKLYLKSLLRKELAQLGDCKTDSASTTALRRASSIARRLGVLLQPFRARGRALPRWCR